MTKDILDIYKSIQDIAWFFSNQTFDGTCCGDLTLVEYMALKKIQENNECAIQELGNVLNITKSGISKIVDRLENKDYIVKQKSPSDGRICCVTTTKKGTATIQGISAVYTSYLSKALDKCNTSQIDEIKNSLQKLLASVQEQGYINIK